LIYYCTCIVRVLFKWRIIGLIAIQAYTSSNQSQLILFVWPIWRVHPKKLTGECGWNYIKEYPLTKHILSTKFTRYFLGYTRQIKLIYSINLFSTSPFPPERGPGNQGRRHKFEGVGGGQCIESIGRWGSIQ